MYPRPVFIAVILASLYLATTAFDHRIIGGNLASISSVPWTASIRYIPSDNQFGMGHNCGGSLINDRTIITAARCLLDER